MSIDTASIAVDSTVGFTGGTATGLKSLGTAVNGKKSVILDDSSDFVDQTTIDFIARLPKVKKDAPSGYTARRCGVTLKKPRQQASLEYHVDTAKAELAVSVETTAAELLTMKVNLCNLIMDADFDDFYQHGSTE